LPAAFVQVRTAGDPITFLANVREAVRQIDHNLPLANVSTQTEQIEQRMAQERLFARTGLLFGALALVIAAIGIFGLMSYSVARRTNEIGIRMALGAHANDVRRLIISESMRPVLLGVVLGVAVAAGAGRLVAHLLFGLAPTDPLTVAAAVTVLLTVATAAASFPARRAARVDPLVALRHE
jgi:ABC-type antimicrobial peptide transport system permease subunit